MVDVILGEGKLAGRGVYANRDFQEGELVIKYNLRELTQADWSTLPTEDRMFTHSFWGKIYLYLSPARYVNHSARPNTSQDLKQMSDYAIRPIRKGEMITTNATLEIRHELETFLESIEREKPQNLIWLKRGYRNAECTYMAGATLKHLVLKRTEGNWHITKQI